MNFLDWKKQVAQNKEEILTLIKEHIKDRPGIETLVDFMCSTTFFIDPASIKKHNAVYGGLADHCLKLYKTLVGYCNLHNISDKISKETLLIIALCHDLCKVGSYVVETKNVKNESTNNKWVERRSYAFNKKNAYQFGHGSLSLFYIMRLMYITDAEASAIYHHMGITGDYNADIATNEAFKKDILTLLTHQADSSVAFSYEFQDEQPELVALDEDLQGYLTPKEFFDRL